MPDRSVIPTDPDALLQRHQTAAALTASGFPTSKKTLAKMASKGGGPLYRPYGRCVLYRWGDALIWARSRLGPPRRSTSEADAAGAAPTAA